jgi:hypothetical protein
MEHAYRVAYRYLLYQAMLDIRTLERPTLNAKPAIAEAAVVSIIREANEAGAIAYWLHNLALASAHDFDSFNESGFWSQHAKLLERYPGIANHYRPLFDRVVAENRSPEGAK